MDPLVSIGTIGHSVQNDVCPMDVQWTSNGTNGRPMDSPMDQMRFHFLLTLLPNKVLNSRRYESFKNLSFSYS